MPSSFNGIGTTYYGQRDFRTDGTYVTTEWIIFFYVPIMPLHSVRLRYTWTGTPKIPIGSVENYLVYEKTYPNGKQVLFTYGLFIGSLGWSFLILWTAATYLPTGHHFFAVVAPPLALPFFVPYILRYLAKRKLRVQ
jgi:hypothetical protein